MAKAEAGRRGGTPAAVGRAASPVGKGKRPPATPAKGAGRGARPLVPQASAPRPTVRRGERFRAVWASGQFVALLGALACGVALAYLLNAGALEVRQFAVSGAAATASEEIAAASGVRGHNVFTVDPQAVAERLIALPTIREAQVWGELPDRLVVRIVERQPAIVWQVGDERFLLDEGGFVIAAVPTTEATAGLPRLVVRDSPAPVVGARVEVAPLEGALAIGRRAPDYGVTVLGLEWSPAGGFALITAAGAGASGDRRIILGGGARLDEKLAVAGEIIRTEQNWPVLNVTDPERPFFPAR